MFHRAVGRELYGSSHARRLEASFSTSWDSQMHGSTLVAPNGDPSLSYAIAFCKQPRYGHLLAVASEDGCVAILDAGQRLPHTVAGDGETAPRALWHAHPNAIFDVTWTKVCMRSFYQQVASRLPLSRRMIIACSQRQGI